MIEFKKEPGQRILELGGGQNRHPQADCNVDVRPGAGVDFAANFEEPLPIRDEDFDGIYSAYCLEHLSYRKLPAFLKECWRVLKPGSRVAFITPNAQAQFEWIKNNPNGWDGKPFFESASEIIFGSQDYSSNAHMSFIVPETAVRLFTDAGFTDVLTMPAGARGTDLLIEAAKPKALITNQIQPDQPLIASAPPTREELFSADYFLTGAKHGGYGGPGYYDFPAHEITFRHVMARKPESVLELGCSRGYVVKRLQDAGIKASGLEISKHCILTRACEDIIQHDVCNVMWPFASHLYSNGPPVIDQRYAFDLCFSCTFLEHVPEQFLPAVVKEMARTCKRGLHGVDLKAQPDGGDRTKATFRPRDWWVRLFAEHAPGWPVEVLDKELLEIPPAFHPGHVPPEWDLGAYANGNDGKVKLNIGCGLTMYQQGWTNIDIQDLLGFANQNQCKFQRVDVRQGLPHATGVVDLISLSHVLECLTYAEGLTLLRECRRVIKKPDGALRVACIDTGRLSLIYVSDQDVQGVGGRLMGDFDELSAEKPVPLDDTCRLWNLLGRERQSMYSGETLLSMLADSGWTARASDFRSGPEQLKRETLDTLPCVSFYADATPKTGE